MLPVEELMIHARHIPLILVTALLVGLTGCRQTAIEELNRQELFTLGLGKMEDQIDLFQTEGELFNLKNRICMRDGLFFIANGNSAKIMAFSSYGDLIYMLYNPERNPGPCPSVWTRIWPQRAGRSPSPSSGSESWRWTGRR